MKKHLPLIFCVTLLLTSCYQHEDLNVSTIRVSRNKKNTTYDNVLDYADFIKKGKKDSRSLKSHTVNPYLNHNGDTIAYVVNYAEGWDLLSNDRRTPLVLASSPEGTFNIEEIKNTNNLNGFWSEMEESLTQLKSIPITDDDILGEGWNALYVKNGSVPKENIVKTKAAFKETYPGENGYWVLLDSETITINEEASGHQIATQWDQEMNSYIKKAQKANGQMINCKAGCLAVAGAQYLNYLNLKYNNPRYMVDNGEYDSATNTYIFTGYSESVWNSIRNSLTGGDKNEVLIGYVAKKVIDDYGLDKSTGDENNLSNFINTDYGYNLSWHNYSSTSIINILKQYGAVVSVAWGYDMEKEEDVAHAFLIDAYWTLTRETTSTYGWVGEDNLGQDTNDREPGGNIVGYAFMTTQTVENTSSTIYMNWGEFAGMYNEIGFSTGASTWTTGNRYYDTNRKILY